MLNKSNFENAIRVFSTISVALLLISENTRQVNCQSHLNKKNSSRDSGNLPKLIFTEENRINAIEPNGENFIELAKSIEPSSPVFSCERKLLYWIERSSKIQAFDYFGSQSSTVIFDDDASVLKGLALDFINDKLYIANAALSAIEVVDLKTGIRGIIRSEKLPTINDIAIDPEEGYLFILGETELIRTDLDGLNLHYILEGPLTRTELGFSKKSLDTLCIALNTIKKRIYWVNDISGTISSSTYNGTNQKFHLKYLQVDRTDAAALLNILRWRYRSPMAFISNIPYWIDNEQGVIKRINSSSSNFNNNKIIYNGTMKEMSSITSIDCNRSRRRQQATNPCKKENGGCQHLCILSHSSESNYRCFCKIGYELAEDGKSCILPTEFIAFFKNNRLRGVNWRKDIKQFIDVLDPSQYKKNSYFLLEADIIEGIIFHYTHNLGEKEFYGINLMDKKQLILKPDNPAIQATEIAFDWASKNLYYISTYCCDRDTLSVLNTKNPTVSKILAVAAENKLFNFGLAVHPNRGYVYFVETFEEKPFHRFSSVTSNVTRIFTDGSNSNMVLKLRKHITCITIDYNEDKLYWSEGQALINNLPNYYHEKSILYHSNLDGKEITKVSTLLYQPKWLRFQGDWIYAINKHSTSKDWLTTNLDRMSKKGDQLERLYAGGVDGFKIFDPSTQITRRDHPCASSENTCDKFCFAVPETHTAESLQRVCGCPYGEKLAENGRSCVDNSKEEPTHYTACQKKCTFNDAEKTWMNPFLYFETAH